MRATTEARINGVIIATGISSVITQLLTIREFLAQFSGNEFVIALIFFNWLVLGGVGTLLAYLPGGRCLLRPSILGLGLLSVVMAIWPLTHILTIRLLRDTIFFHGSAVGFYGIFAYTLFTTAPYCIVLGFVLPYSLLVLRRQHPSYPGAWVYITDNIGDIAGGVLFSFVIVFFMSPLQAVFFGGLPLLICTFLLLRLETKPVPGDSRSAIRFILSTALPLAALVVLAAGVMLERPTLALNSPELIHYEESRYGRITVENNNRQLTLRMDGMPIASTRDTRAAEEAAHFPLSQIGQPGRVLLISARAGILQEIEKHRPSAIDYVEIDPHITGTMFRYGFLKRHPNVNTIHADAKAFLLGTDRMYDAVIACIPEPATFQTNRFYTDSFFALVRAHLNKNGVFSFSMAGVDNYIADTDRRKLSAAYSTASKRFSHVKMIPGNQTYFLCAARPFFVDIPGLLEKKGIRTDYIQRFYAGDVTPSRLNALASAIMPDAPQNRDTRPILMKFMFAEWFTTFDTSPVLFYFGIGGFLFFYFLFIKKGPFVLFTTGFANMAAELLTIFAFQIFFGYIYYQIGMIVTVFLAGLLPGAWLGERSRARPRQAILRLDIALIILTGLFVIAVCTIGSRMPVAAYLVFGFFVSTACGFQFPMILHWQGDTGKQAVGAFSADLIGAAFGALMISTVFIPYTGLKGAAAALIGLKIFSIITVITAYEQVQQT